MTVTNGTVEFERVVRPADFESKRVKVSLTYAIGEDTDAATVAAAVGDMAHAEVMRMLRKPETKVVPAAKPVAEPPKGATSPPPPADPPPAAEPPSLPAAEEKPITDDELNTLFKQARARGVSGDQIKKEVNKLVAQPGMLSYTLDQPKRAVLVDAIKALKPAEAAAA